MGVGGNRRWREAEKKNSVKPRKARRAAWPQGGLAEIPLVGQVKCRPVVRLSLSLSLFLVEYFFGVFLRRCGSLDRLSRDPGRVSDGR